jgi:hypothetical protein
MIPIAVDLRSAMNTRYRCQKLLDSRDAPCVWPANVREVVAVEGIRLPGRWRKTGVATFDYPVVVQVSDIGLTGCAEIRPWRAMTFPLKATAAMKFPRARDQTVELLRDFRRKIIG